MSTLQEGIERLNAFALPEQTKADVIELVEAAYELGAAEMRERCAKAAEKMPGLLKISADHVRGLRGSDVAALIRTLPDTPAVMATQREGGPA